MSDAVWGTNTTPNTRGNNENRSELARCQPCQTTFWRPKGSTATHVQVDPTVSCGPDADVSTNADEGRWARS